MVRTSKKTSVVQVCDVIVNGVELMYNYKPEQNICIGQRVSAPIINKVHIGILSRIYVLDKEPEFKLKSIIAGLDNRPLMSEFDINFLRYISAGYYTFLPKLIRIFLPKVVWTKRDLLDYKLWDVHSDAQKEYNLPRVISNHNRFMYNISQRTISRLAKEGLIKEIEYSALSRNKVDFKSNITLNKDQKKAVDSIDFDSFKCSLLYGVTGSGKTAVYQHLISKVINEGNVMVLIPEIRLSREAYWEYKNKFPEAEVDIINSKVTKEQFLHSYFNPLTKKRIVLNTRCGSACPIPNLKLIIMDEEHDGSYKHESGHVRYHARNIAINRAWKLNIPIILGSATPSFDMLNKIGNPSYQCLKLPVPAVTGSAKIVTVIDDNTHINEYGITTILLEYISASLNNNYQVLIFLNKVGYARELSCLNCNWSYKCPHCQHKLHLFYDPNTVLKCSLCEYKTRNMIHICPSCEAEVVPKGIGTESVSKYLQRKFKSYKVFQMDSYAKDFKHNLEHIKLKEPCIIVGTQMVITGYDFKNIGLVGIIGLDSNSSHQSWHGSERCLQLIYQAMGRTGRHGDVGRVVIQSHNPTQRLLSSITKKDYMSCALTLMPERQKRTLPPFGHLAYLYLYSINKEILVNTAGYIYHHLCNYQMSHKVKCEISRPLPCLHHKIAQNHRIYIQLKSLHQIALKTIVDYFYTLEFSKDTKFALDFNPINLT